MTITGKQFDMGRVTAKDDASLYSDLVDNTDYIIPHRGNNMQYAINGLNIILNTGVALIQGRMVEITSNEVILVPANSSGFITIRIDLTTPNDFTGIPGTSTYVPDIMQVSTGYHANIVQEDLHNGGMIYDAIVGKYTSNGTTATFTPDPIFYKKALAMRRLSIQSHLSTVNVLANNFTLGHNVTHMPSSDNYAGVNLGDGLVDIWNKYGMFGYVDTPKSSYNPNTVIDVTPVPKMNWTREMGWNIPAPSASNWRFFYIFNPTELQMRITVSFTANTAFEVTALPSQYGNELIAWLDDYVHLFVSVPQGNIPYNRPQDITQLHHQAVYRRQNTGIVVGRYSGGLSNGSVNYVLDPGTMMAVQQHTKKYSFKNGQDSILVKPDIIMKLDTMDIINRQDPTDIRLITQNGGNVTPLNEIEIEF